MKKHYDFLIRIENTPELDRVNKKDIIKKIKIQRRKI